VPLEKRPALPYDARVKKTAVGMCPRSSVFEIAKGGFAAPDVCRGRAKAVGEVVAAGGLGWLRGRAERC